MVYIFAVEVLRKVQGFERSPDEIMRISEKAKEVRKSIFDEISIPEYISWWVVRFLMAYSLIRQPIMQEKVMAALISLSLFTIPILRFFAPKRSAVHYMSPKIQTMINLIAFAGSFMGNYICVRDFYSRYDRFLHVLSGSVCVLIGYYIFKAMFEKRGIADKVDHSVYAVVCSGFSLSIVALWEILEFGGDFFFGTTNQAYRDIPDKRDWWFLLFGPGNVSDGAQFPVWDTMLDMTDATLATIITALILRAVLKKAKEKLSKNKEVKKEEVTV